MQNPGRTPILSVIVVVHNIPREAPRTLHSLSAAYQRHIDPDDYEVIVVDNGSDPPFDLNAMGGLTGNFRVIRIDDAPPSPAHAVNRGLAEARGDVVGVMIDGARIVTPGLLHFARHGVRLYDNAVVATLGWYLGHDYQNWAIQGGYNRTREDALLASIEWPNDGYRLFDAGTMDESSVDGWFQPISESNALFMRRELWASLGGVDERFDFSGGGLVNLDTFRRALELPDAELVILLGEATFHQVHGGVSTNAPPQGQHVNFTAWGNQYSSLRGRPYEVLRPAHAPTYLGTLPRAALARMVCAAVHPNARHFDSPLGADFNRELWTPTHARSTDPVLARLVDLAEDEFRQGHFEASCAVARLIRERAPDDPGPQRLLSTVSPWLTADGPSGPYRAEYHLALGTAHRILGEIETAASHDHAADRARADLALQRMPGDDYLACLARLYGLPALETVLEIGVDMGASLSLVPPAAMAIGVDPAPRVAEFLKTQTHIFAETSDEFFAEHRLDKLLGGRALSVGFIDGLHLYEQALRDFMNIETSCGPASMILLHDTVPLDEATQNRARSAQFYTGDVWKVVLCLKHYRPDLNIFTIATPPSGLTVVTGLDPTSHVLRDHYDEACARFIDLPFSSIEHRLDDALNIVANNWATVEAYLKGRRIMVAEGGPRTIDLSSHGDGALCLGRGWSFSEDWGVWSLGPRSELVFPLDRSIQGALVVRIEGRAAIWTTNPALTIVVRRAERILGRQVLNAEHPRLELELDPIDTASLDDSRTLRLSIGIDAPQSPARAGISADQREIGLGLERILLSFTS